MPSPFPGMDPYLEGSQWSSMHFALAAEIARQLAPRLRPKYFVRAEERQVVSLSEGDWGEDAPADRGRYPDVSVTLAGTGTAASLQGGGTGTLAPTVEVATLVPAPVPHVTLEIRDAAGHRLVCSIEILSPINKGSGYKQYLRRRNRVLLSQAHLVEIDLLRRGRRVPARDPIPAAPYYVYVSRAERRPLMQVWSVQLADCLPTIPVPLLAGDADLPLNLQDAFTAAYDLSGYDLSIDYSKQPRVRLTGEQVDWASGVLGRSRSAGVRPPSEEPKT